ncbi:DNA polymerase III subunit psi [Vibrio cholerae]
MSLLNTGYLHEMGIDTYQLEHPSRLQGVELSPITLDDDCRLLLVSPVLPQGSDAQFLQKVLQAMSLTLEHVRHVYPHQAMAVNSEVLTWVWYAGCDAHQFEGVKTLVSPELAAIDGNQVERRALWQQIQTALKGE